MQTRSQVQPEDFEERVLHADGPVIVDFYAPWCSGCQMMEPVFEDFANRYSGRVQLLKVNVDTAPQLARRYDIHSVPTLVCFNRGELTETVPGFGSLRELRTRIDRLVQSAPALS